ACRERVARGRLDRIPPPGAADDRVARAVRELEFRGFVQTLESGKWIPREVLVPDDLEAVVSVEVPSHGTVDGRPEKCASADHIVPRQGVAFLESVAPGMQNVPHQERLLEEIPEVERPVEPLEAAHDGLGPAHDDDHDAAEPPLEPPRGEDRERVLQHRSVSQDACPVEGDEVPGRLPKLAFRAGDTECSYR